MSINIPSDTMILERVELYLETLGYGIKDLIQDLNLSMIDLIQNLNRILDKNIDFFNNDTIFDVEYINDEQRGREVREIVHEKMHEYNIIPRETRIWIMIHDERQDDQSNLFDIVEDERFHVNTRNLLKIIFPDEEVRRVEVYTRAIIFAQKCKSIARKTYNQSLKHPYNIYANLGLYICENEDFKDLILDVVNTRQNFNGLGLHAYSLVLMMGVFKLIQEQLKFVVELDEDDDELIREIIDYYQTKERAYRKRFFN